MATEAQYFGSRMVGSGPGRMLVWRVLEELVANQGHITMTTSGAVSMTPHDVMTYLRQF